MIKIQQAKQELLSSTDINRLYEILIHAYAVTEQSVWGENYVRIPKEEFITLISRGEVFYAQLNDLIVGSVYVYCKDESTFSFGLLSADFSMKGKGIGKALVDYAEEYAIKQGAKYMDLEILRPISEEVLFKEVLKQWYTKLGYVYTLSGTFEELKPKKAYKAKGLIQPCTFDCYQKVLA